MRLNRHLELGKISGRNASRTADHIRARGRPTGSLPAVLVVVYAITVHKAQGSQFNRVIALIVM